MKTTMKFFYAAFTVVIPAIGALTANGAPGDLIAPDYNGKVFELPINPFRTPSVYADLAPHGWVGCAFDRAGNLYLLEQPGCTNCGNIYELAPDRATLTLFAAGLAGTASELVVDVAGNVYEGEEDTNCNIFVYRFDPQGVRSTFATIPSNPNDCVGSGGFGNMAFDSQGNLFLSSGQYVVPGSILSVGKIYKITPQGQASVFCDLRIGYATVDMGLDSVDNVFVMAVDVNSSPMQPRLFVYTSSGAGPSIFGGIHNNYECRVGGLHQHLVIDNGFNVYMSTIPATITQYPPTYDCEDPASLPHIYIGNPGDPYETLGQLAIEPQIPTPTPTPSATATATPTATPTATATATATSTPSPHPAFFTGETALGNGVYYLQFPNGTPFGYYAYLTDPRFIYHFDMGYEYWFDANDGHSGIYFYDFMSNHFFYTSPGFPFPYLYDFSLNTVLYYYPDPSRPGHYTTNPRYFYNFATGQIITM